MRALWVTILFTLCACKIDEAPAVKACSEKLEQSLAAPSTLKIVWSGYEEAGAVTRDDMLQKLLNDLAQQRNRFTDLSDADKFLLAFQEKEVREGRGLRYFSAETNAKSQNAIIEYDAQNRMGVSLRSFYLCRVVLRPDDSLWLFSASELSRSDGARLKSRLN